MSIIREAFDAHMSALGRDDQIEFKDKINNLSEPQRANLALEIMKQHPQFRHQVAKLQVGGIIPLPKQPGGKPYLEVSSDYKEKKVVPIKKTVDKKKPVKKTPAKLKVPVAPPVDQAPDQVVSKLLQPNTLAEESLSSFLNEKGIHKHPDGLVSLIRKEDDGSTNKLILNHATGKWEKTDNKKRWSALQEEYLKKGWPYSGGHAVAKILREQNLYQPTAEDLTPQNEPQRTQTEYVPSQTQNKGEKEIAILSEKYGSPSFTKQQLNSEFLGNKPPAFKMKEGIEVITRTAGGDKLKFIKNHQTGKWEQITLNTRKEIEGHALSVGWPYTTHKSTTKNSSFTLKELDQMLTDYSQTTYDGKVLVKGTLNGKKVEYIKDQKTGKFKIMKSGGKIKFKNNYKKGGVV